MPFIPLGDNNPRILIRYPWVTWGTMLACVLIFLWQISGNLGNSIYTYGFIPAILAGEAKLTGELLQLPAIATLFTSIYLHGSLPHLLGNMLFLWVFGDNIEDSTGHIRFLIFYLLCGAAAGLCHFAAQPGSDIPMVGASGAISGVLGAYLVIHPKARVLIPVFIIPVRLPAYILLAIWIGFQFFAVFAPGGAEQFGNVAWWAHIGGFVAGAILIFFFKRNTVHLFGGGPPPQGVIMRRRPYDYGTRDRNAKRRREAPTPSEDKAAEGPKGPWG